jgi:urea carboxylase
MSSNLIKRVLIANRGAIAVRIIRTLSEMSIESVVVYSEADRESLHVRLADHAYSLGEGNAAVTYLDQAKLIAIAKQSNSTAIHPGYGFLSENTDFVTLCEQNDILFLGPTAQHIATFGLKHKARELAELSDTPLLPGSGILADRKAAAIEARHIGYPLMLKSTAGGGGIGMQLCRNEQELLDAWGSVSKLSANNFSNADLFIEKFVERARHIEVQIFGDGLGNAVAIGERDCSAQRRNQKVLEETPAPNLSDEVRQMLQQSAIALVASINYRSAGTVEFIFDADSQQFYFLEVNTRLQVEHGVTEEVYGIDIVRCMIELANSAAYPLHKLEGLCAVGHAIQARVYAEDPIRNFKPSAGLLSHVYFPPCQQGSVRIDSWVETGIEVSSFYDPMLAKVIAIADDRDAAMSKLKATLEQSKVYGIETNIDYLRQLIDYAPFVAGHCLTSSLADFEATSNSVEVLVGGTMTTIQDAPGRIGYWDVGVPPSGPFDNLSFALANRLLANELNAAGLEMTMNGAHLKFANDCQIALTGALMDAKLDDRTVEFWQVIDVAAGQTLKVGKIQESGSRSYLAISGGLQCPQYLGSRSTFTLGQFGGHAGRALRVGDVLHTNSVPACAQQTLAAELVPAVLNRSSSNTELKQIRVIAGPQGAPDYFSAEYIETFFSSTWKVHYNSSRTGVRLIGPKPVWAREDGGEAGLHPSNIHDNAYAIGTIDFTGDMPVILGPDGPSLGGFVCPATVITADFWMIGQLAAGDQISFVAVTQEEAVRALKLQDQQLSSMASITPIAPELSRPFDLNGCQQHYLKIVEIDDTEITLRQSGDSYVLIEYGEHTLDIELRFKVHQLMLTLQEHAINGVLELTPGIRSLQVHFDVRELSMHDLIDHIIRCARKSVASDDARVPSRIVHLPLSWDDQQCKIAIDKYDQSVRKNAPWFPSNIEFIRRINGLNSVEQVKQILFDAKYLVMGLGDVYLGAPVATPVDPAHRLVTTKYNPARTWTAENSVGIGGSYLCVYGMEGPGGYQFVGRTLQMWNRYRKTKEFSKPWLLRFFDQIQFYPVSEEELLEIRKDFPLGNYPIRIQQTEFSLAEYKQSLRQNKIEIDQFSGVRESAFNDELTRWKEDGQFYFEHAIADAEPSEYDIAEGMMAVDSPVSGSIWEHLVAVNEMVEEGQVVSVIESMKMEIQVHSQVAGKVIQVLHHKGDQLSAGSPIMVIEPIQ